MATSIPAISLLKAKQGEGARREVAAELVKALEEVGFLYLDDVDGFDPDVLRRATEWFFSLPGKQKLPVTRRHWYPDSPNIFRGYFPAQGAVSNKECLGMGIDLPRDDPDVKKYVLYEPNLWPNENGGDDFPAYPGFKSVMLKYFEDMSRLSLELVHLIAIGIGVDEHLYDELFLPKPLSTLRLLHYPPRSDPPPPEAYDGDVVLQCEPHTDTAALSLVATFEFGGLQLLTQDEKWLDVPPRPNSLVMNVGDMLSRITKGRLKATLHRVATVDKTKSRFSVPFFLEPCYCADIGQFLDGNSTELRHYGPWCIHKMTVIKKNVEHKDTDFGDYTNVES